MMISDDVYPGGIMTYIFDPRGSNQRWKRDPKTGLFRHVKPLPAQPTGLGKLTRKMDERDTQRSRLPVRKSTEPIIAYRMWRLFEASSQGPFNVWRLRSVTMDDIWEGPTLEADGKPTDFKYAVHQCHGIYAYNSIERCLAGMFPRPEQAWSNYPIMGSVELYGKVVIHEQGYRAERLVIKRLLIFLNDVEERTKSLEETYQCEVFTDLADFRRVEDEDRERARSGGSGTEDGSV